MSDSKRHRNTHGILLVYQWTIYIRVCIFRIMRVGMYVCMYVHSQVVRPRRRYLGGHSWMGNTANPEIGRYLL